MPITMLLEQNCKLYPEDIALVELNPAITDDRRMTWREYDLVESAPTGPYRREITWRVFNEKANRFANLLLERGIKKGDKVGILLMNCLEWLPIYFGTLKTGALAVPLNFRYTAEEIEYCVNLAECDVLVFGQEFIGRVESIADRISKNRLLFFYGDSIVPFAEDYTKLTANCSSRDPRILITDEDYAAIYFSSGTTGFPKAILHNHESLMHSAKVEQKHHGQTKNDVFLCIPPLYHTGAKMHWFGSLISGSKAVLLKGTKPEDVLAAVSNERCSIVWLLVPWAQDILDALDSGRLKLEDYNLKKWRLMHIGAQPVPPSMIKHWKEYFPNHLYDTNYGLSESIGPGCVHLGTENIHKVGAIGVPGFGWQCKIVDEDHNEITEAEKVGELAVFGPGVMTCYYNDPIATTERRTSSSPEARIFTRYRSKTSCTPSSRSRMSRSSVLRTSVSARRLRPSSRSRKATHAQRTMWRSTASSCRDTRDRVRLYLPMFRETRQVRSRSLVCVKSMAQPT